VRAAAALALGPALVVADRLDEATRVMERALDELGDRDPGLAVELQVELLSSTHLNHDRWPERVGRLAAVADGVPPASRRAALGHLAQHAAFHGRPPEEVRALALEGLGDGLLLEEQTPDSPAYYFAASALVMSEDFALSRDACTAAREEAERRGSPVGFAFASAFRALPNLRLGDLDAAEADSLEALRVSEDHGLALALPGAVIWLLENLVTRGKLEEADALLDRFGFGGELPPPTWFLHLYEKRGSLRLAQGRVDEALADFREAGRRNAAAGNSYVTDLFWRSYAAQALMALDRRDEARSIAAEELRLAREFGGSYTIGRALFGLAATQPDGHEALATLGEARDRAAAAGAPVLQARAAVAQGAMLRRLGRRAAARALLSEGLELAAARGVDPVDRWAREELATAGARARRRPTSGLAALTPSELRIARLAAAGTSNRGIARALFVTEKTVETHLTAVYTKLDITSRRELPAIPTVSGSA
jgi:ATP/maltotriose-dependent transcriptional regulator MalT